MDAGAGPERSSRIEGSAGSANIFPTWEFAGCAMSLFRLALVFIFVALAGYALGVPAFQVIGDDGFKLTLVVAIVLLAVKFVKPKT